MTKEIRTGEVIRKTKETDISISVALDGKGTAEIDTGIGFFDHMLTAFAVHGGFGLSLTVRGDLQVDGHHTVEDTGIVLGRAFALALGDRSGIERYGTFFVPMDEALGFASVDVGGRAFLAFDAAFPEERCGDYDTCLTEEFFRALSFNAGMTLHLHAMAGKNSHHIAEALYKAAGHALKIACQANGQGVLSTKGVLD